jgi:hypothetical protein
MHICLILAHNYIILRIFFAIATIQMTILDPKYEWANIDAIIKTLKRNARATADSFI